MNNNNNKTENVGTGTALSTMAVVVFGYFFLTWKIPFKQRIQILESIYNNHLDLIVVTLVALFINYIFIELFIKKYVILKMQGSRLNKLKKKEKISKKRIVFTSCLSAILSFIGISLFELHLNPNALLKILKLSSDVNQYIRLSLFSNIGLTAFFLGQFILNFKIWGRFNFMFFRNRLPIYPNLRNGIVLGAVYEE